MEVLKQILDAFNLPEEHIELEPHLDLDGDRGLWLHPEAGPVPLGVWPHPILELAQVAGVRLVKVRPRHEGGGLHLALSHVLKSGDLLRVILMNCTKKTETRPGVDKVKP